MYFQPVNVMLPAQLKMFYRKWLFKPVQSTISANPGLTLYKTNRIKPGLVLNRALNNQARPGRNVELRLTFIGILCYW